MAKRIVMDEFHLTVSAPGGLREEQYDAIKEALDEQRFQADLRRSVRDAFRRHPPLEQAHVTVSR